MEVRQAIAGLWGDGDVEQGEDRFNAFVREGFRRSVDRAIGSRVSMPYAYLVSLVCAFQ